MSLNNEALRQLLLPVVGNTVLRLKAIAQESYTDLTNDREIRTHDGQRVYFFENRFEHAFMRDPHAGGGNKQEFDVPRLIRVRWIGYLVSGTIDGTECYEITQTGRTKRLYIYDEDRYICWLEPRKAGDGWTFSTAYVAMTHQLKKYRANGTLIWHNK